MSKDVVKKWKSYSRDSRVGSNINSPVYSIKKAESDENIQAGRIEGQYLQLGHFSRRVLQGKDPSPTGFDGLRCAGQDQRGDREVKKGMIYFGASLLKGDVLAGGRCSI